MKKFSQYVQEANDLDPFIRQGRQANQQQQQGDAKFKQRKYLFAELQRLSLLQGRQYNTPQEASELYNQLGRSTGIHQLLTQWVQKNPTALQKILTQWIKLAAQGELPT
jgi:hypothetical protein